MIRKTQTVRMMAWRPWARGSGKDENKMKGYILVLYNSSVPTYIRAEVPSPQLTKTLKINETHCASR